MSGLTVDELIAETRNQLDEANIINVTDAQILAALNRGQRKGTNIIATQYDSLFVTSDISVTTEAGVSEYAIPAAAFGKRIEKLEILENNQTAWDIRRIGFHKTTPYVSSANVARPYYYALTKNKFQLYPAPAGSVTVRIWYLDSPGTLVKSQGRITTVNSDNNYVLVDSLGADITTDTTDGFNAYVNFIDYTTGDIKGSAQVASIDTATKKVTFKTSGLTRSSVLGRTISTALPTDLSPDDFICILPGTCLPEIPGAYTDYLMQYAVVDIRRRLGEPTNEEYGSLKDLETEIVSMWAGREASITVRQSSRHWQNGLGGRLRRYLR